MQRDRDGSSDSRCRCRSLELEASGNRGCRVAHGWAKVSCPPLAGPTVYGGGERYGACTVGW